MEHGSENWRFANAYSLQNFRNRSDKGLDYSALPLIRTCVSPDSAVLRTLDSALT